jgi:hypothetical protein
LPNPSASSSAAVSDLNAYDAVFYAGVFGPDEASGTIPFRFDTIGLANWTWGGRTVPRGLLDPFGWRRKVVTKDIETSSLFGAAMTRDSKRPLATGGELDLLPGQVHSHVTDGFGDSCEMSRASRYR